MIVDLHTHLVASAADSPRTRLNVWNRALVRIARFGSAAECRERFVREFREGPVDRAVVCAIEGSPLAAQPLRTSFTWNVHSNDVIRIERRSSPASQLEGFTIQDAAGKWYWADARITGRDTVKVWADGVSNPKAGRYNGGMQGPGNLYNAAGLPASCFTTEP